MPARTPKGRDDLVMGTNSSSIVSKRSVERIYFPDEPQYYRYFVSKFQRRAPLINRGYHLRMHLVDAMVRAFLCRPASRPKLVVNLGCGSDPLPWRTLSRHADACRGVSFVDVDFPDLMARKRDIVRQTTALQEPLTNVVFPTDGHVLLTSDQYVQVACDLRDLAALDAALAQAKVRLDDADVLFVAEVSITYMEPDAADALVRWAGARPHAEFCLLEQILPDGPANPFAQTMLQHFDKLNTPLKCIHTYPTVAAQAQRFHALGWAAARTWSLWEAWQDPVFLAPADRCRLDDVEVFDEWEEFVHFASHYFLLYARNGAPLPDAFGGQSTAGAVLPTVPTTSIRLAFSPTVAGKRLSPRRFGAALLMKDVLGRRFLSHVFGAGTEGRLRSCDLYANHDEDDGDNDTALLQTGLHQGGPAARMCFTLTDLGAAGVLLAGGRASPSAPFRDAWLFKKDANHWARTLDLPVPLFRHAAARLGASQLALVVGGKTGASTLSPDCFLFHPQLGWVRCTAAGTDGDAVPLCFGATLLCTGVAAGGAASVFHGLLAGGMTADGLVSAQAFCWRLDVSRPAAPVIRFSAATAPWVRGLLCRFGAACAQAEDGWAVVAGGVDASGSVLGARELVRLRLGTGADDDADGVAVQCLEHVRLLDPGVPRPVLVGASLVWTGPDTVAVVGGGMTCFSMGTVWARGVYSVCMAADGSSPGRPPWQYRKTATITNEAPRPGGGTQVAAPSTTPIPRLRVHSEEQFRAVLLAGKPVVLEGLDLGGCVAKWTADYLREQVGAERPVVVHEATSAAMDFLAKNFRYATQPFGAFLDGVAAGRRLYLRALSAAKPSEQPAQLDADFPGLAGDFALPPALAAVRDNLFSSVLRISGPVTMWLHYDVLANVYCQIRGTKRFCLFPPGDVTQLGFAPGASSSSMDVFALLAAAPAALGPCRPHEAVVGPGDVLFLPPLWLHTATPVVADDGASSSSSVAVNVFFRDLQGGAYAAGRDVYGNRDLAAYEKARQDVARMAAGLAGLPRDARAFYAARVADELLQLAAA